MPCDDGYQEMKSWSNHPRIILIGNAVHAHFPMSGVGESLAAEDSILLAKMLKEGKVNELIDHPQSLSENFQKIFASFVASRLGV